jgi:hypothetical protein
VHDEAARGGAMEVHKPKRPIRAWREFLKEVGIIVLGVLIALGAEQSVEWLNWRIKAGHADVHLRRDAASVLEDMVERLEIQKCQDGRLTLMRDRLLASGPAWSAMAPFYTSGPPAGSTYAHPMRGWPRTSWTTAVASTAAMHLPGKELDDYAHIFAAAEREANDQATEHEASSELNVLGLSFTLTPDQKVSFLRTIEAERARNRVMAYEAQNTLPYFEALGMDAQKARIAIRNDLAYQTCVANHLT